MNREPLPIRPSSEENKQAIHILAIELAHCEAEFINEEDLSISANPRWILQLICGVDSHDNERSPDDLDAVECEAYTILCAHFGVEPEAI